MASTQQISPASHHGSGVPKVRLPLAQAGPPHDGPIGAADMAAMRALRWVRIAFGVSQTSRDKDPVLSVSTEWTGDEIVERVYTEREATFRARGVFGLESMSELDDDPPSRGLLF